MTAATSLAPQKVITYSFRNLLGHPRRVENNSLIGEGILKNNAMMVLGGPPKAFKSFSTSTKAVELAIGSSCLFGATRTDHGRSNLAFPITKPCRVLILEQEVGEDDLEDRLKPLYHSLPPEYQNRMLENLFTHSLDHDLRLDTTAGCQAIEQVVSEVKPEVLVLDPLIEFHCANENDTQSMALVMRNLSIIQREFDPLASIINHHEGKETILKRHGADRLRGNSVIYGKGDTFLMIHVANRNAMIVNCEFTLRRGKPINPFSIRINPVSLRAEFNKWGKVKVKDEDNFDEEKVEKLFGKPS